MNFKHNAKKRHKLIFKSDIVKTIVTMRSSKANKFLTCCWIVPFLNLEFELSEMRISVKLAH